MKKCLKAKHRAPHWCEGFRFTEASLLNLETVEQSMHGHEIVWHLGANTDIPGGNRVTDLDLRNCTIATCNVLEAMRENGVNKILFTSSGAVYCDTESLPLVERFGHRRPSHTTFPAP